MNSDKVFTILRRRFVYSNNKSFNAEKCASDKNHWSTINSIKRMIDVFIHFFIKNDHSLSKKKTHQNANDLFRFSTIRFEKKIETEFYYMKSFYHTNFFITKISDQKIFLKKITENIIKNWYFVKIMKKLKNQIQKTMNRNEKFNVEWQAYRFDFETRFLYFKNKKNSNRLCIFESCHKQILHYAHDEHAHGKVHRTYDLFMKSIFISKMKMLINDYVISCLIC